MYTQAAHAAQGHAALADRVQIPVEEVMCSTSGFHRNCSDLAATKQAYSLKQIGLLLAS